jgi:predicted NUDIX family NTP pyrophosphohydrolase
MALISAGCVVTRERLTGLEVLLVHPKRATFHRPVFGIPKGLVEAGEDLEAAAARETLEETGLKVRIIAPLGHVRQKSGKVVHAFHAVVAEQSDERIDALGRCRFPDGENDVCRFYPIAKAYNLMIPAQRELLDRLQGTLTRPAPPAKSATTKSNKSKPARRRRARKAENVPPGTTSP